MKRMQCSNWRFALFLLIMSGFWCSFQQIYITLPEYIRDFTQTRPMLTAAESVLGKGDSQNADSGTAAAMATISESERLQVVKTFEGLASHAGGRIENEQLAEASRTLLESKVRLLPSQIGEIAVAGDPSPAAMADRAIAMGRQVNPEFIMNIDAGAIILFQMVISFLMGRFHRFTTIITGIIVAGVGFALWAFAGDSGMTGPGGSVWIVALGIFIFAVGEMMASPTSQEYVGRIAPGDKKALYMGYYFVSMALGFLLGGILSGQLYGKLARDMQRPDLMWLAFAGLMFLTALAFWVYNRFAVPTRAPESTTPA
jgi:dipeptide/tripeptide permease